MECAIEPDAACGKGKRFELQITAPELHDPVFVKFAVAP